MSFLRPSSAASVAVMSAIASPVSSAVFTFIMPVSSWPAFLAIWRLETNRCSSRRRVSAAADEQNRVVTGDRAGNFRELRAIDPFRQTLRLTGIGSQHEQRIDALEAAQKG